MPTELRNALDASALFVGPGAVIAAVDQALVSIRHAIRSESKLHIRYRDLQGRTSDRVIWPFALGFFDQVRIVAAWCERRRGYRHFRTDRIADLTVLDSRYPRRRQALLKEWREIEGIAAP